MELTEQKNSTAKMRIRPKGGFLGVLLTSFLLSLLLVGVLLLVSAKILLKAEEPLSLSDTVSLLLPAVGSLCGGFLCGKRYGGKGFFCGLGIGLLYILFFAVLFFAFPSEGTGQAQPIYGKAVLLLAFSLAGGILGSVRRVSGKKRRHR